LASSLGTRWLVALLVGSAWVLLFAQLGKRSLLSHDEAWYAQVAKQMDQTGNWLTQYVVTTYVHMTTADGGGTMSSHTNPA